MNLKKLVAAVITSSAVCMLVGCASDPAEREDESASNESGANAEDAADEGPVGVSEDKVSCNVYGGLTYVGSYSQATCISIRWNHQCRQAYGSSAYAAASKYTSGRCYAHCWLLSC